jgi:hypothetical protein
VLGLCTTSSKLRSQGFLAQAASVQVRKTEAANSTQVDCSEIFQDTVTIAARMPLTCRFLRTSENSRYAKFARITGSFPKRHGNGLIGRRVS